MDDRQLAFLARQPSAALKNRERFLGMPKRGLAFLLANVMFWQPLWAQADGIVVSAPGTSLGKAGNGVPIVNIAKPNGSGLSHNTFTDYNVGSNGIILNNATSRTQSTQLGGIILGNPNLNGTAATTILNEVNGGNPSQLRGYTEVAGQSAHVIVANPYGITCNGCGFINSPKVTLSTGKPVVENGRLDRYQVDQGSVSIEGAGLNANNVDHFEIITRSAKINAEIQAKNLTIVAGRNDVNADTLNATARADDGSAKPELAIDSSALGGMYAGAIKLVGTEAGVGVKLDGKLIASGGDIQLDANGHLSMVDTSASGAVNVKAASVDVQGPVYAGTTLNAQAQGDLTNRQTLAARDGISLSAGGQLSNNGIIEAGVNADNTRNASGDVSVTAQSLNNSGKSIVASRNLTTNIAQTLNNQGGTLSAGQTATVKAGTLDNQNKGRVLSSGALNVTADKLLNTQGIVNSNGNLTADVGQLFNNAGELGSLSNITLRVASLDNVAGLVAAGQSLNITASGQINNQGGRLTASTNAQLNAGSLDNRQGSVSAQQGLNLNLAGQLLNAQGSVISSDTLRLKAGQVNNAAGRIASAKALDASVTGLDQQDGELFSNASLSLDMNQGELNNQGGLINASGALLLSNLKDVNNQGGEISSQQAFTLAAQNLDNSGGKLLSNQGLMLRIAQVLNNARGAISAASVDSRSNSLDNSDGLISSRDRLDLTVDALLDNQRGSLIADGALLLVGDRLDNRVGEIVGKTGLNATVNTVDNRQGTLISTDALKLTATSLDNRQAGLIGSTNALDLDVDDLDNRGGELSSSADVTLVSQNLDNSDGGQVFAGQTLKLTVDKLLNRTKGLLSAKAGLDLDGGSLDSSGGYLISQQNQRINLSRDLLNNQGQLSSEGSLDVTAANLTNTGGSLSSAKDLTVHSLGGLDNQGGELVTDGALLLTSAALDNRQQGRISAKGAVDVTTGAFDNSQNGRLNSASTLNLVAGQVTNQGGASIGSQGALTASVTGLDQQGGTLFSNTTLSLDMNNGQLNNQGGLINAPGTLLLKNLNGVNNLGGEISSAEAFTLAAQNLTNDNGKLLSSQGLTLRIAQALNNVKGMIGAATVDTQTQSLVNNGGTITSRGNLVLTVDQQLDNQAQGLISAAQLLTLNSGNLNNQGGSVLAGGALVLNAMALNNSTNGLINAQGDLTFDADSLDSSDGGEVSAKGDINLTLTSLTQDGGRLLGEKAVTLNLGNGDLNNRNGLITAKGPLTFNALRDLNNQGGEISSSQSFDLKGRTLDNSGGKLISSQNLGLDGQALINQNGLISGWQGLLFNGTSLDNRNNGTLSSRNGNVNLNLLGNLLNGNGGALVSQGSLGVTAASVDNTKGILSSSGAQSLILSGTLDNGQGGLIDSGAGLTIKATSVANVGGAVNAQQTLILDANDVNNRQGTLVGNAEVNLNLNGVLDNSGAILASAGPLTIKGATAINNQGGQIASQDQMTLTTGSLDNSNTGTIAAKNALAITATSAVQNHSNGLIYSQAAGIELDVASLANSQGQMQSQTGLDLALSGELDNQGGKLIAQTGDVSLTAANIDNRGGTLAAVKGALDARTVGVLRNGFDVNNKGGVIQAQRLDIRALAGLNNNGGRIAAQAGDVILKTADLNNRSGGIYATGLVNVSGANLDNSAGQIAGNRIELGLSGVLTNTDGILESDSTLAVRAASVDNQGGRLRALGNSGKTDFQIGGLFDNRSGRIETANSELTLNSSGFKNLDGRLLHTGSGTFDISTANLTDAGGSLVTRGALTLAADSWTNSSVIQAGRLTVNVNNLTQTGSGQLLASTNLVGNGGNWSNDGLIASDGTANLLLGGTYSGNGQYSSLGNLGLTAASMSLGTAGSVASGGTSTINISGQLNNSGRMTSASGMTVNAGSINNFGTLGSSGDLRLAASSLLNQNGLIFSGGDMALRVNDFTNRFADVYGLGNVSIGRDDNNGWSASIANISASIESGGDLTLAADHIENRKDVFEATGGLVSGAIGVQCYSCSSFAVFQPHFAGYLVWEENYQSQIVKDSASANLTAGRNFIGNGGELLNNASTISAGNDLTLNLQNFTNQGAGAGTYSVRRSLAAPDDEMKYLPLWRQIMDYNAANDPSYDSGAAGYRDGTFVSPNLHVWNSQGVESLLRIGGRRGGGEAMTYLNFGGIWVEYQGGNYGFTPPRYNSGVRTEAPAFVKNAAFFENTITYDGPSDYANAVVQAGGAVRINASQNLTNSVVREGVTLSSGASKVGSTQLRGQMTPAIVEIHGQLPPNLAQQQLNPLTLPGFSLPTGQNGLFRLSGQSGATQQATQANAGPQSWTLGGASISTGQRQQGLGDLFSNGASPLPLPAQNDPLAATPVQAGDGSSGSASVAGQTVARVQGLPDTSFKSNPQKYLIETNPVLTDLKQFMSSDYLLENLGYDPDQSAKRLGDGLYEQRLIQEAVVARTGQRFIDGQTSNEDMFKYLMNNAIASKQELDLAVGVSLTSEQVAALTHDIVWLEEHVVNGEKVLVPVLYMAQANNRLAPNGALIQGADVQLIAGQDLKNAGTLRATNNLSAKATNDIVNSGLVEAAGRLDLLADKNIVNKAGGILAGRDVNLTTSTGDVLIERSITASGDNKRLHREYVDSAARIEAANDLTIKAGGNFTSNGGVLQSGRDTTINVVGDAKIVTAEQRNSGTLGRQTSSVTQYGSTLDVGRDLVVRAGRNLAEVGSQIEAKRDIGMTAVENVFLSSAANESHSYSKSKKVTTQEDHVKQVGSSIKAGGDIFLSAGKNMAVVSTQITAGDEAYLVAGEKLELLAAQDSDYSLYDRKKKGRWGKQFKREEVTKVTHVGSEITTGGGLKLMSGGDQKYQVAKLNSGGDLTLQSGGAITFEGVKDLDQESHTKTNSSMAWNSMKGKGHTDETLRQSELVAKGDLVIKAVDGLKIDIKHIDQKTVSQTIDAMVQADPELAWLKEAEKRGDVDWRRVEEIHQSFQYSNSGLGVAAQMVLAIVLAVVTGGAGAGLVGAGAGTFSAGFANAVLIAVETSAVNSAISNQGDLGAVLKDITSSESLKGYVVSGMMGGIGNSLGYDPTKLGFDWNSAGQIVLKTSAETAVQTALQGGSLGDNLVNNLLGAVIDIAGAVAANSVGDHMVEGSPSKIAAHALVGGLKSMAMGGDFKTGALAGGANEALIGYLAKLALPEGYDPNKPGAEQAEANLLAMSQLLGVLTAVVSGSDPRIAAGIAANATQNNFLNHTENTERLEAVKRCNNGDMQACARRDELNLLDVNRDKAVWAACDGAARSPACTAARTEAQIARFDLLRHLDTPEALAQLEQDLKDPDLVNFTVLGELRSIKVLDDAVVRQISTGISKSLFSIGTDLAPGVGDVKAFAEAEDAWDYIFASIGVVPGAGDIFAYGMRESKALLKEGKAQEASDLLESLATYASDAKDAGKTLPEMLNPTYRELKGLNKGFQAHHTLPQYLGEMLGYTRNDMLDHPATLITQYAHTGAINPDAMHKAISQYLPPMKDGKKAIYTPDQIKTGLQQAYKDIGRPELFESVKYLIK
ncbi:filamentous hemagglutinin N-terminal domain-containing protein [Pseudomonas sp. NR3]|uniref:two-partner secretion domain-containing protein n=1 Tax=Pseudomonas sp. NR3 TaxID=3155978 RepID=UPI003B6717C1